MRTNQKDIQSFFFGDLTSVDVIAKYGIDSKTEKELAVEIRDMLCKDAKRFKEGWEIYIDDCDRKYTAAISRYRLSHPK